MLEDKLAEGIHALGLNLSVPQQQSLMAFLHLLVKWNKAYNLTAVRDPAEMVTRHLLDSLAILPYLHGETILDVGSGAGLPGIPLAIADPSRKYVLLDSNGKKVRFMQQAATELHLKHIIVVQDRAEHFASSLCFDSIVVRAMSDVSDIITKTERLLAKNGQWLLMKGRYPEEELKNLMHEVKVSRIEIPGLAEERHLVIVEGHLSE